MKDSETKSRYEMKLPLVMRSRSSQHGVTSDPASATSMIRWWKVLSFRGDLDLKAR